MKRAKLWEDEASVAARLVAASVQGQVPIIKSLVRRAPEALNHLCEDDERWRGRTALAAAACSGQVGSASALLGLGASVTQSTTDGETAVHCAVRASAHKVLELFDDGLDVQNVLGETALFVACQLGDAQAVKLLTKKGASVDAARVDGDTPLVIAAYQGYLECARLLLNEGADVDARDSGGETALFAATGEHHAPVVSLLLQHGATPSLATADGRWPLFLACYDSHNGAIVRLLLERTTDLEQTADGGYTALYVAARQGQRETVDLLLRKGANPDASNVHHETPLFVAAREGHADVVKLLLTATHDLNARSLRWLRGTALHAAAARGHMQVVHALLSHNADIRDKASDPSSLLHIVVSQNVLDTAWLRYVDVSIRDDLGRAALDLATDNLAVVSVFCNLLGCGSPSCAVATCTAAGAAALVGAAAAAGTDDPARRSRDVDDDGRTSPLALRCPTDDSLAAAPNSTPPKSMLWPPQTSPDDDS